MIAETAAKNPDAELELLAAAERGLVPAARRVRGGAGPGRGCG